MGVQVGPCIFLEIPVWVLVEVLATICSACDLAAFAENYSRGALFVESAGGSLKLPGILSSAAGQPATCCIRY